MLAFSIHLLHNLILKLSYPPSIKNRSRNKQIITSALPNLRETENSD